MTHDCVATFHNTLYTP